MDGGRANCGRRRFLRPPHTIFNCRDCCTQSGAAQRSATTPVYKYGATLSVTQGKSLEIWGDSGTTDRTLAAIMVQTATPHSTVHPRFRDDQACLASLASTCQMRPMARHTTRERRPHRRPLLGRALRPWLQQELHLQPAAMLMLPSQIQTIRMLRLLLGKSEEQSTSNAHVDAPTAKDASAQSSATGSTTIQTAEYTDPSVMRLRAWGSIVGVLGK